MDTASNDLATLFEKVTDAAIAEYGISREALAKIENNSLEAIFPPTQTHLDIHVPIVNGQGTWTSAVYPSFWVNACGTATITAPAGGIWHMVAIDLISGAKIFDQGGITQGQPVKFSYKTGFRFQLLVRATWSLPQNTTLTVGADVRVPC